MIFHDGWNNKVEERHVLATREKLINAEIEECNPQFAMIIARCMADINAKVTTLGASYAQQYILKKGLDKIEERGAEAATKELDQLHKRNCFTRDKSIKGRLVYNGKLTREWLSREEAANPTAALESIMLTASVDAKEERDVMTADVPLRIFKHICLIWKKVKSE